MIKEYILCGYIGAGLFTINLFPQVYKIYKTKSAKDVSYWWQLSYLGGASFSMVFAMHTPYTHMKIGLGVEITNILLIMYLKTIYSKPTHVLPM